MKNLTATTYLKQAITFIFVALLSTQILAMDLDSAKSAGLIGEQANGYLGIVSKPATDEVVTLVKSVNSKRKSKYQEIAKEKGVDLAVVEKRAGAKVIEKTASGDYINTGSSWVKK